MTVTYPYATTSIRRDGTCALCVLTGTHPERDEVEPMYSAFLSEALATTLCKAHAIECDLITDRLVAARNRAEVAVLQHLREELHRHDVCPLPHEEEASHRETPDPSPLHA